MSNFKAVRVKDIILDIDHPLASIYGGWDSIGTIFYTKVAGGKVSAETSKLASARPFFSYLKHYPLINETVVLITTTSKNIYKTGGAKATYYLPNINQWNSQHHNALPLPADYKDSSKTSDDYKITGTGIVRQTTDGDTDIPLGEYFDERMNLKPLLPYEGDSIVEGRFGNSIRIGSTAKDASTQPPWSEIGENGDPIIIIRNGQSEELDDKGWVNTIENINQDASSIYLTSNQKINNLIVATAKSPVSLPSFDAEFTPPEDPIKNLTDPPLPTIETPTPTPSDTIPKGDKNVELIVESPPTLEETKETTLLGKISKKAEEAFENAIKKLKQGESEEQIDSPPPIKEDTPQTYEEIKTKWFKRSQEDPSLGFGEKHSNNFSSSRENANINAQHNYKIKNKLSTYDGSFEIIEETTRQTSEGVYKTLILVKAIDHGL